MRIILMCSMLALTLPAAFASSPAAWDELYRSSSQACLQKSGLRDARILEGPITFSGAVLYRIGGIWPQAHMQGKIGKVYCLHPYPDGAPEIAESLRMPAH
jgi:hypothetical protein